MSLFVPLEDLRPPGLKLWRRIPSGRPLTMFSFRRGTILRFPLLERRAGALPRRNLCVEDPRTVAKESFMDFPDPLRLGFRVLLFLFFVGTTLRFRTGSTFSLTPFRNDRDPPVTGELTTEIGSIFAGSIRILFLSLKSTNCRPYRSLKRMNLPQFPGQIRSRHQMVRIRGTRNRRAHTLRELG